MARGAYDIEQLHRERVRAGRTELDDAKQDLKWAEAQMLTAERDLEKCREQVKNLEKKAKK